MHSLLGRVRVGLPLLLVYALARLCWPAAHSSVWAAGLVGVAVGAAHPHRAAQTLLVRLWRAYLRYRDSLDANEPIPEPTVKFVPVFMGVYGGMVLSRVIRESDSPPRQNELNVK